MCIRDSLGGPHDERQHEEDERQAHRERAQLELQHRDPDPCLLYTSDAADERSSVDLGGRRIIKKKKTTITKQWNEIEH